MSMTTNINQTFAGVSTSIGDFIEFTLYPSLHFNIQPSDNPSFQLVALPFNGTGLVILRNMMITYLSTKNKLGLVDGSIPQPGFNSPCYSFWERCNHMDKAWITNSLSREISMSVMCLPTAKNVLKDINDRFGQSNGSKYIQNQSEIASSSQGDFDIVGYFTKMRSLWDELNSTYVGPLCTCGALTTFIQDQQLFQFLSGLNESYSIVKSTTLMMSPLPSLSKVYSLL